jgi:aspartate/methionine/tyrosine aminotransferase
MGAAYADLELFSFHSTSKGVVGECGRRGGYVECSGIDAGALEQLYKLASIMLCPTVQGQIMVRTRPPASARAAHLTARVVCVLAPRSI